MTIFTEEEKRLLKVKLPSISASDFELLITHKLDAAKSVELLKNNSFIDGLMACSKVKETEAGSFKTLWTLIFSLLCDVDTKSFEQEKKRSSSILHRFLGVDINDLVQKLRSDLPSVQCLAVLALGELDAGGEIAIRKQLDETKDMIGNLVHLLRSASDETKLVVAAFLKDFIFESAVRTKQLTDTAGAIDAVVHLLASDSERNKCVAAGVLANITSSCNVDTNEKIACTDGVLVTLINALTSDSEATQNHAALALANLVFVDNRYSCIREKIAAIDNSLALLARISISDSEEVTNNALQALASLALNFSISQKIVAIDGLLINLVGLLTSGSENIKMKVMQLLGNLVSVGGAEEKVAATEGVIPALKVATTEGVIPALINLSKLNSSASASSSSSSGSSSGSVGVMVRAKNLLTRLAMINQTLGQESTRHWFYFGQSDGSMSLESGAPIDGNGSGSVG